MCVSIVFGPDHPAWRALDDDDWCGHTFAALLNGLDEGTCIVLDPGDKAPELIVRMAVACARFTFVRIARCDNALGPTMQVP